MSERGKYIVIEGGDGIGKTTQAKLLQQAFAELGHEALYLHEPGGTPLGEEIERRVKDKNRPRTPQQNLDDFTEARVAAYEQVIAPLVSRGGVVVADRNWLSSVAYQGVAERLGIDHVVAHTRKHLPDAYVYPDLTIHAQASREQREQLLIARGTSMHDFFEQQDDEFQADILRGYNEAFSRPDCVRLSGEIGSHAAAAVAEVSFEGTRTQVATRVWQAVEHRGLAN